MPSGLSAAFTRTPNRALPEVGTKTVETCGVVVVAATTGATEAETGAQVNRVGQWAVDLRYRTRSSALAIGTGSNVVLVGSQQDRRWVRSGSVGDRNRNSRLTLRGDIAGNAVSHLCDDLRVISTGYR